MGAACGTKGRERNCVLIFRFVKADGGTFVNGLFELCLWKYMCVLGCVLVDLRSLQPSGHYMYRHFNIQQFYVLPTQCICVFCVDLRTNSDYFTVQH